jgi:hypothetical protein
MPVWFWITVLFFLLFIMEELIYYLWNRYIYGANNEKNRKWQNRLTMIITFFKRKKPIDIQEVEQQKSSQ